MKDDLKSVAEAFGVDESTGQSPVDEISQAAQYQAFVVFEKDFRPLAKRINIAVSSLAEDMDDLSREVRDTGLGEDNITKKHRPADLVKHMENIFSLVTSMYSKATNLKADVTKGLQTAKAHQSKSE